MALLGRIKAKKRRYGQTRDILIILQCCYNNGIIRKYVAFGGPSLCFSTFHSKRERIKAKKCWYRLSNTRYF